METYTRDQEQLDLSKIEGKPTLKQASGAYTEEVQKWDKWFEESKELRRQNDARWAKNIKLLRGIWPDDEIARSKVRKRSKIFFRKIWASNWRILAAMHDAFLRETDQFQVIARNGEDGDEDKAEVLQFMTEYRRDVMMRNESLFIQLIWSIMTILDMGWACAKFGWKYKKDVVDKPDFVLYPNEQVYPDLSATLPHKMRYIFFENYMTAEDMKEEGYSSEGCDAYSSPESVVRNARFQNRSQDPLNFSDTNTNSTYPQPGAEGVVKAHSVSARYCVRELFYREDGKIKMAVYCGTKVLVAPMDSPYGERYPIVMGQCLTLAHQMIGEGFPEPQEGPQESYNVSLNQRKDNVSIVMNGESLVDRYANVDLEALRVSRPANTILTDNVEAVKPLIKPDVTQTAYMEAQNDAAMMDETSGVTDGLRGLDKSSKATTSQINFSNAGAKMGLFMSIVAQTWFRDFFTQLAYMIQRFETDETVFRVSNRMLKKKQAQAGKPVRADNVETVDDFIADIDVRVQPDMTTRQQEAQNIILAMDRAIMSNQALVPLAQAGIIPPEGVELMNPAEFMRMLLPKLGQKNVSKFFIKIAKQDIPPPAPSGGAGGKISQSAQGANTAQAESPDTLIQNLQEGNAGATAKLG